MATTRLRRRSLLALLGSGAAVGLLAACGGSGQLSRAATAAAQPGGAATSAPAAAPTAAGALPTAAPSAAGATPAPTAAPVAPATPIPTATPGVRPLAIKSGQTELRIWFHWGGKTGDSAQSLINTYNSTQGEQDKLHVTIETIDSSQMLAKMTAVRLAGTPPDVYSTAASPKVLSRSQFIDPFPTEEEQYVKQSYNPGAVERVTLAGKIWGYPTEYQPAAYIYRTSWYDQAGIKSPPASTDDEYENAAKLTQKANGKTTRYGYTLYFDGYPTYYHLPGLIARFGGQMFTFDGDRPAKIDVASQPAIDAVGWWKKLVDAGTTQVAQMPYTDSWKTGLAASTEIEVWFTLINLRDAGRTDVYDDLDGVTLPPKQGVKPTTHAYGWMLAAATGAKHPEERWSFLRWMMHKPAMPFSKFIVETVGSAPAPIDYPTPIPGWSAAMNKVFTEAAKTAQANPRDKVLGEGEVDKAITDTVQAILLGKAQLAPGLQDLNARLNAIIQRTDAT